MAARFAAQWRALLERAPRAALIALTSTGYASLLVFLRGRPDSRWDGGIFLSVAAGLLKGDRLYSGVWDNKPPFFYYGDAIALRTFGWRGPFLIDVLWLALAAWSFWLLLRAVGASRLTAVVGFLVYPLFLTGAWYYTGYSELPALALAPFIPALWVRGAPGGAGAVLALALFFRPDYALILLALLGAAGWLCRGRAQPVLRALGRLLLGFGVVAVLGLALIAARGELPGFIHTMVGDLAYPNRALRLAFGFPGGLRGHLDAIRVILNGSPLASGTGLRLGLVLVLGIGPAALMLFRARSSRPPGSREVLAGLLLAAAAGTVVTLVLTTVWTHHLEPLALPAALLTVFLVTLLEGVRPTPARLLASSGVIVLCLVGLAGTGRAPGTAEPLSAWWHTPANPAAAALNEAHARSGAGSPVTYAQVGKNDGDGSAAFLHPGLRLVCPHFAQYVFSSRADLNGTLECLDRQRPDLVLVTPSFAPAQAGDVGWNAFVRSTTALLRRQYVRRVTVSRGGQRYVVWQRRA